MNTKSNSCSVKRACSLAAAGLLASACAVTDGSDGAPGAEGRLEEQAPDASVPADDGLLPPGQASSPGAYFAGSLGCRGASGVLDAWGGTDRLEWPGALFTVTGGEPAQSLCQMRIEASSGRGLQLTVIKVAHRGSLRLAEGAHAALTTTFRVKDQRVAALSLDRTGPDARSFEEERAIPAEGRVWSECGKPLDVTVTHAARIDAPTASPPKGELQLPGDPDQSAFTVYLGFRRCTPPPSQ